MTDTARLVWKQITEEMLAFKEKGATRQELALFTDQNAPRIIAAALTAAEQRGMERAAQIIEFEARRFDHIDNNEARMLRGFAKTIRRQAHPTEAR